MARLPEYILLARYRLNRQALREHIVSLLDFPAAKGLNDFITRLNAERHQDRLKFEELPTYRRLNSALLALSPPLVHAFETVEPFDPQEPERITRQMMAHGRGEESLPTPNIKAGVYSSRGRID